jgi:methionyl-tRNA synthetase
MPDTPNKFYLTTPIYYVNARPHIGHAYSTIAADVLARRHRLLGDDTFFLTGTDEHGQKVQRSAAAAGVPPQEYADQVSASFRNLWKRMGITNDDYIRTTDERHKRGVQHLWRVLEERGAIYLSSYTGQYCVSDEAFVDVPVGAPCPTCGRTTETITEENYFFKLSEYQEKLINLIESGELHIQPETAKNEVLSFVRGNLAHSDIKDRNVILSGARSAESNIKEGNVILSGARNAESKDLRFSAAGNPYIPGALKDLSISRTTFDWGIPVPTNPKHVVYVWLDALANYITAIGYGAEDRDDLTAEQKQAELAKFARYWPADIHLVGKEITRFHCVYWPAFLMAAGIATPKSVVANGWLLFEESKMSKSRGNVVRTETILDAFGPLCPPVPSSDTTETVILSEARSAESKDLRLSSAAPTKAQQDLFAADVLRYFLLREIPFGQDGSFSFDALITRYNADLANGYGNLVSRTLTMIEKYFAGSIPSMPRQLSSQEKLIEAMAAASWVQAPYEFHESLTNIWVLITDTDRYINSWKPWKLADDADRRDQLAEVLYSAAEFIRVITARLHPFLPYATASVWRQLGLGSIEQAARNGELKNLQWGGLEPGTKLGPLAPIFPRADKGLAQIMTDMENPTTPAPAEPAKPAADPSAPTAEALNAVNPTAVQPPATSAPAAAPSTPNPVPSTSTITIDDFAKVDLRVAEIVVAERIPKADKLLRLEVDLGPSFDPPRRQILAGIAEHYAPEALIGRKVVIVANLAPRKMRGLESNGMIVAASVGPDGAPVLVGFAEDVELGARLK